MNGAQFHQLNGRLSRSDIAWREGEGRVVLSRLSDGESEGVAPAICLKFVLDGEERYEIGGRGYRVAPGQFLVVGAGTPVRAMLARRTAARIATGLCIYLPARPALAAAEEELPLTFTAAGLPIGAMLTRAARRLVGCPDEGSALAPEIVARARAGLAGLLIGNSAQMAQLDIARPSTRRSVQRRLELARGYLHDHVDRAVSLAELAREAGMSAFQLARYFNAVYGMPPAAYHRAQRMGVAAERLRRGLTPTEIADLLGFADLSSFTHSFKRWHGVPPTAFATAGNRKPGQ